MTALIEHTEYSVWTKASWAGAWESQPNLICESLLRVTLPSIDRALLQWRVGNIKQENAQFFDDYLPLDISRHYVRIAVPRIGVDWVGQIVQVAEERFGDKLVTGLAEQRAIELEDQYFTAYHISWLLSQNQIDSATIYSDNPGGQKVKRAFGYNNGMGDTRTVDYTNRFNRDERLVAGTPVFAKTADKAEAWNGYQILQSVLAHHADGYPVSFIVDPEARAFLSYHKPTIRTEGRCTLDVINDVLEIRRGLVAWFEYVPSGSTTAVILHVSSVFPANVTLPSGHVVPKALSDKTYDFDDAIGVKDASIVEDGTRYGSVRVRGALRTSTFTVSVYDENLDKGWEEKAEDEYKKGKDSGNAYKNDRARRALKFDRVYQVFVIPDDWDGKAGGLPGAAQNYVNPLVSPGSISVGGSEKFSVYGMRMSRETPLKSGFDYDNAEKPIDSMEERLSEPDFMPMLAIGKHKEKYVFLDKADGHIDEDEDNNNPLNSSYSLRPLSGEAGIEVRPSSGLPHSLALNHFDPRIKGGNAKRSKVIAELDFEDVLFTVCAEFDSFCEGVSGSGYSSEELVIYIGDNIRLDWLARGTVIDINDDGTAKTVSYGGPVQDDRVICEDIARIAYEWYSLKKAKMTIEYDVIAEPLSIGSLITSIGTTGSPSYKEVNSVVTRIIHNLHKGTSVMTSSFAELDFRSFV